MKKNNHLQLILLIMILVLTLTSCNIKTLSKEEYIDKLRDSLILENEECVAIDLRGLNEEYANGHIQGFINYDYQKGNEEEFITYMKSMYNKKINIFLIDDDGSLVNEAARALKKAKYKKIFIYQYGYASLMEIGNDYFYEVTGIDDCGC